MNGRSGISSEIARDQLPALAAHAEISSQKSMRCGCSETNQHSRLHYPKFGLEPRTAGLNFWAAWFLVDTPFATFGGNPLEMLYHVRYVNLSSENAGFRQGFVENLSGRASKGSSGAVFLITRLLAYKHDFGFGRSFAEDGLSGGLPQVAGLALACSPTQVRNGLLGLRYTCG